MQGQGALACFFITLIAVCQRCSDLSERQTHLEGRGRADGWPGPGISDSGDPGWGKESTFVISSQGMLTPAVQDPAGGTRVKTDAPSPPARTVTLDLQREETTDSISNAGFRCLSYLFWSLW